MLLTGEQVLEHLVVRTDYHKVNQVGVDLSVCKIERIIGGIQVLIDKTEVPTDSFQEIPSMRANGRKIWRLYPGPYALTFNEGVIIPATCTGFITSRSSIYRGGAKINSPMWDPGFRTEQMGTTLFVQSETIYIEKNARVGQFYMIRNPDPGALYDGQFQNKTNY